MNKLIVTILVLLSANSYSQVITKSIYFETGKWDLSAKSRKVLDSIYSEIMNCKNCEIDIKGHTDNIASFGYNASLSSRRAEAASSYLTSKGIKNNIIKISSYGESMPSFSNTTNKNRSLNRRVDITLRINKPVKMQNGEISSEKLLSQENNKKALEKDTVIRCSNGTMIEIKAGAFSPRKVEEINFNIQEYNNTCDLLNSNIRMVTDNGDCLTSGGMVMLKPTVDTLEVHPNAGYKIRISIPAYRNVIDKEMKVYVAKEKDGSIIWSLTKIEMQKDEDKGIYYYVIETDSILGYNIDKNIRVRCEEDGPIVKVRGFKNTDVYMTYPDEMYLSKGIQLTPNTYSLVKAAENKIPKLTVVAVKDNYTYLASGPMPGLKFKEKKNTYIVKKKYFKLAGREFEKQKSVKDILCERFTAEYR